MKAKGQSFNIAVVNNQCDAGITSEMLLKTKDRNRPTCFFTSFTGHEPLFISGQEITLKEGFKQETEEMPICATSLLIGNYGVFYRFYKLRYSRFKDEIASRKRFIVTKKENYTTYTTLCRSNETNPCNIYYHSKTKKPQPYHQCVIAKKTETIVEKCWSTAGCFIFRYLSSTEKLVGCADKIPSLIEASPSLSPLMWCVEKIYQKEKYRCRAFKGTTNLIISGTLCCCYKDCFIMMDEDEYGFNPFEVFSLEQSLFSLDEKDTETYHLNPLLLSTETGTNAEIACSSRHLNH
ncbi:unnamed protein product [Brugia pahangi]|uniref:DUF3991 domain-containing protein n=1 Tax=Brugia pahangi TaxID=6280 RepID=A0A0N4SZW8_BRUPA|nr:unnamed protein product [Brugia pahangi]